MSRGRRGSVSGNGGAYEHDRPLRREHVDKGHSAKTFRRDVATTDALNLRQAPMRGGWRL